MEKTIQITIGGTQFQITEAAYDALHAYLVRLKTRFASTEDGAEIISDIEARIAEKLFGAKLVTAEQIAAVIADMGDAAELDEEPAQQHAGERKLYRNTDDEMIAGVASGVAAYFGFNVTLVRLAFLVSLFFSGIGLAIYIVLWLVMPPANTVSQKLEMKGARVTLDSIAQAVQDRVDEAKQRGIFSQIVRFPAEVVKMLGLGIFLRKVIGFAFSVGSFIGIIVATALLGIALTNWNASWNDIPHKEFISGGMFAALVVIGYIAIVIPLFFVLALGQRLFKNRMFISTTIGFGLTGIWALSLVGCGVLGTKIAGDYYARISTSPDYAQTVDEHAIEAVQALDTRGADVTLRSGDTYSVRISGRKIDMKNISLVATSGTLTIRGLRDDDSCIFCSHAVPSVIVTVPALTSIKAESGSLSLDELNLPALSIDARNANVSGKAKIPDFALASDGSWTGLDLIATSIAADVRNGRIELDGSADTLSITARNASVEAESLRAKNASIDAQNSRVSVFATGRFDVTGDRNSDVRNASSTTPESEEQAQ